MTFSVSTSNPRPGVCVVTLEGEVDVYTSPRLKQELIDLLGKGNTHLIVNLDEVKYLDSTGLGVLIGALKRTRERDGDLKIACANQRILRIFDITGLTKIFEIHRTNDEATDATPA
jgi:anti-sigma B factor antagonist